MAMAKNTKALVTKLYPLVEKALKTRLREYKGCVGRFINKRNDLLYDIAPCDRIFFGKDDIDDFFMSMKITIPQVREALSETYYYKIAAFNPRAAKDEFTVTQLMVCRYFLMHNKDKDLELAMIYLGFSGKFYPSIHYAMFPKVQPSEHRYVMEFVVNNALTGKYDLKSQGNVIGSVRSITNTWYNTYKNRFRTMDDEDAVYLIQQLHNRIKSFIKNIAVLYYRAYEDKEYLTYDSEDFSEENYRLVSTDAIKAQKAVDAAMNVITSSDVNYKLCKMASDSNVKTEEIKSIIQTIMSDNDSLPQIKELITLLVFTYFEQAKGDKDVRDISFITYSIAPKPNSKDPHILRQKEIIEKWLMEGSPAYRKRKNRIATRNSYYRAIYIYFTLLTHNANK